MVKVTVIIATAVVAAAVLVEGKIHGGHHGHHHGHHHAPSDTGSSYHPFDGSDDKGKPWSGSGFGGRFPRSPDAGNSNEMPPFQTHGSFYDDHHGNEKPNNEQPPSLGRHLKGEKATEGDKESGVHPPRFHGSNDHDSWHGSGSFDGHFPHQPNAGSNEKPRVPRGERGSKPPENTENPASKADNRA